MEWTDGMEYQLIKIARTHHGCHGKVVSDCLNYRFNYHSSRNNRTTGSLPSGSASWPFRIMSQVGLR